MKYFIFFLLILMFNRSFSQIAYYDAKSLRKMVNAAGVVMTLPKTENDSIKNRIWSYYKLDNVESNPFLNSFFQGQGLSAEDQTLLKSSRGNFLSGLNVTK